MQRERVQVHFVCDAVVQPAVVVDDVPDHPRGGRPAHDEHDVLLVGGPTVPEMVERGDEFASVRVEAGQFVDEQDDALLALVLVEQQLQAGEGLKPVLGWRDDSWTVLVQSFVEHFQLVVLFAFDKPRHFEDELAAIQLPDEEGLADPSAAIQRDEFRFARVFVFPQQGDFRFSADDVAHVSRFFTPQRYDSFPKIVACFSPNR